MIAEYSKVLIKSTNRVGTVVEFDDRKMDAIHLIELTDTEADDRMVWADAGDLEELPPDEFPAIDES
ncbi:hypothetical protein [Slackia isoflavoniconvertens]|uniref:hypothetical protein n=1 Tax=Slackia isoflavoniconvertens TaxID=572010 RepID=UPI00307AF5F0